MTRMNGPSTDMTSSSDDYKDLEWLLEAFGSKISAEDMASAYCQSGRNLHEASEMLMNMLGSSSSNNTHISTDDLTNASASSIGSTDTPVVKSYEPKRVNTVSERNGIDNANQGYNEPPRNVYRPKNKNSGISMGTVSGMIGASDYGRLRAPSKEAREVKKPVKLMSSEFPASELWDEKPQPLNARNEIMNKDIEQFLLQMLGDGFQLDMEVIKEVAGGCGYDVRESVEKLMNTAAPTLDLEDASSSVIDQKKSMNSCEDLESKFEEKLQFGDSAGSDKSNLEKEILTKLFSAPDRFEVEAGSIPPKREPRIRKYGVVNGPLEDPVITFSTPIVKKEVYGNGNEVIEDNYDTLREAALENWITMKQYYRAAAEAFVKGSYELANKFIKQGHFYMDKAGEANEMSAKVLTRTRDDGEAFSIDLNGHDPKEAIRLLRTQLKSMSGIPSIRYLKVMVGANVDKNKPNARKRVISKLLERDAIPWTEEQDGQIMAIRIDVINPKRLSFYKK